jgi:hypothetical protein
MTQTKLLLQAVVTIESDLLDHFLRTSLPPKR